VVAFGLSERRLRHGSLKMLERNFSVRQLCLFLQWMLNGVSLKLH
jgi:hypothetical protein